MLFVIGCLAPGAASRPLQRHLDLIVLRVAIVHEGRFQIVHSLRVAVLVERKVLVSVGGGLGLVASGRQILVVLSLLASSNIRSRARVSGLDFSYLLAPLHLVQTLLHRLDVDSAFQVRQFLRRQTPLRRRRRGRVRGWLFLLRGACRVLHAKPPCWCQQHNR